MTDTPDTTTLSGAEFHRHVGTDPEKWAEAYLAAYDHEDVAGQGAAERLRYTCAWFRDFAEVRVAEEVGRVTARLVPRQE